MSGALRLVRSAREHRAGQHPQPREGVVDEAEQSQVRRVAPLEDELDRRGPHLAACMACAWACTAGLD